MKEIIEEIRKGILVIKHNGSLEQLQKVLDMCFPEDSSLADGDDGVYYSAGKTDRLWYGHDTVPHEIKIITVTEFLDKMKEKEEFSPKEGDRVLVSNNGIGWGKRIFLHAFKNKEYSFYVVSKSSESSYLKGRNYVLDSYKYMKPLEEKKETVELTKGEKEILIRALEDSLSEINLMIDNKRGCTTKLTNDLPEYTISYLKKDKENIEQLKGKLIK